MTGPSRKSLKKFKGSWLRKMFNLVRKPLTFRKLHTTRIKIGALQLLWFITHNR